MHASLVLPLLSIAFIGSVSGRPSSCGAGASAAPKNGKAVYIISNEKENQVLALPIDASGLLSQGTCTATGGAGSIAVDANNQPAVPDALVSQSALTVAGNVSLPPPPREILLFSFLIFPSFSLRSMLDPTQQLCSQSIEPTQQNSPWSENLLRSTENSQTPLRHH